MECLHSLLDLELLPDSLLVDFVKKCQPLLLHPLAAIRESVMKFISLSSKTLGEVDTIVFLLPSLLPYFHSTCSSSGSIDYVPLSVEFLLSSVLAPLDRLEYRIALTKELSLILSDNGSDNIESIYSSCILDLSSLSSPESKSNDAVVKVELLTEYLQLAAREIHAKTLQWKSEMLGSRKSLLPKNISIDLIKSSFPVREDVKFSSSQPGTDQTTYSLIPENTLQSLLIPHQKFGVMYFPPLSTELRRQNIQLDNDLLKNIAKLRVIFGITASHADAARAIASGLGDLWESSVALASGSSQSASPTINPNSSTGTTASNGNRSSQVSNILTRRSTIARTSSSINDSSNPSGRMQQPVNLESSILLKRIRALDIPPLPPDVGPLLQPDGRPFRYTHHLLVDHIRM